MRFTSQNNGPLIATFLDENGNEYELSVSTAIVNIVDAKPQEKELSKRFDIKLYWTTEVKRLETVQ